MSNVIILIIFKNAHEKNKILVTAEENMVNKINILRPNINKKRK